MERGGPQNESADRPVVALWRRGGSRSAAEAGGGLSRGVQYRAARLAARPLAVRAAALAPMISHLGASVAVARNRIRLPRLGERVVAARAPKLLAHSTRLAPAAQGAGAATRPRVFSRMSLSSATAPTLEWVGGGTIETGLGWEDLRPLGLTAVDIPASSEGTASEAVLGDVASAEPAFGSIVGDDGVRWLRCRPR